MFISRTNQNLWFFLRAAEIKEPPDMRYMDPAMIGILAGMALMFIILCVVLRLFSKYVFCYLKFFFLILCIMERYGVFMKIIQQFRFIG